MITFDDFVLGVKRDCNFGKRTVTSDRATTDIVDSTNRHRKYVGNEAAWDWLIKTFTITIVADTQEYTLNVDVDHIWVISNNKGGYLRRVSLKELLRWHTPPTDQISTGVLGVFCYIGRNETTGARRIKVAGNPSASDTLTAYCLKKFDDLTVADITSKSNMLPHPDEVLRVVRLFVLSDIERIQNNQRWEPDLRTAEDALSKLVGTERSEPADDVTSPLPEYYRSTSIMRRNGLVA